MVVAARAELEEDVLAVGRGLKEVDPAGRIDTNQYQIDTVIEGLRRKFG